MIFPSSGQIGTTPKRLRAGVTTVVLEKDASGVLLILRAACAVLGFGFCVVMGMMVFLGIKTDKKKGH